MISRGASPRTRTVLATAFTGHGGKADGHLGLLADHGESAGFGAPGEVMHDGGGADSTATRDMHAPLSRKSAGAKTFMPGTSGGFVKNGSGSTLPIFLHDMPFRWL
jgi:hypothetical protein